MPAWMCNGLTCCKNHVAYCKGFLFYSTARRVTISHRIVVGVFVKMVGVTHSIRFVRPALAAFMFFAGNTAQADQSANVQPSLVEVFTTTDLAVTDITAINHQPGYREFELHVYKLDGIDNVKFISHIF